MPKVSAAHTAPIRNYAISHRFVPTPKRARPLDKQSTEELQRTTGSEKQFKDAMLGVQRGAATNRNASQKQPPRRAPTVRRPTSDLGGRLCIKAHRTPSETLYPLPPPPLLHSPELQRLQGGEPPQAAGERRGAGVADLVPAAARRGDQGGGGGGYGL
jgi:hypothetical protein